jgi:putative FmdB family regulatory protein
MPIYEFRCEKCMKITVDVLPISSQRQTTPCQFCGDDAKRMVSAPSGFKIKGYSAKNGYSKGDE